jgi:predicted transcriptional regulator
VTNDGDDLIARIVALSAEGKSQGQIAKMLNVSQSTVSRKLREYRAFMQGKSASVMPA